MGKNSKKKKLQHSVLHSAWILPAIVQKKHRENPHAQLIEVNKNFQKLKFLILFYFILFIFRLFYFILFYFILFYFILFSFILFYFILFYFILFYFTFFKVISLNLEPNNNNNNVVNLCIFSDGFQKIQTELSNSSLELHEK